METQQNTLTRRLNQVTSLNHTLSPEQTNEDESVIKHHPKPAMVIRDNKVIDINGSLDLNPNDPNAGDTDRGLNDSKVKKDGDSYFQE